METKENRIEFSKTKLASLPTPATAKRENYYDTRVPKLALRITPSGTKTFYVVKRQLAQMLWVKLGSFVIIGIKIPATEK